MAQELLELGYSLSALELDNRTTNAKGNRGGDGAMGQGFGVACCMSQIDVL